MVSRSRLQDLEACALRAEFDARNIQLLQEQVAQAKEALAREQACSEKQAEAFMEVARASDNRARDLEAHYANRVRDLEAQYTEKLAKLESAHDAVVVAKDASIAELQKQNSSHARAITAKDTAFAKLERDYAALKVEATALRAEVAAQLAAVHAAVTSKFALELHPVRRDRRQFATLHFGPVPFDKFDTAWCAVVCGKKWKVDIDPGTQTRAHVKRHSQVGHLTLRGAAPLPRRLPCNGTLPQQLPSYCVVIEAYPPPDSHGDQYFDLGFVPSHTSTDGAPVTPVVGRNIYHYGGWSFQVQPAATIWFNAGVTAHGWRPLPPRDAAHDAAANDTSAYATTVESPPVPAGSAVAFAVDFAEGTCRVAFYTPEAVAGGFVEAPYAKMELRFIATTAGHVPDWGDIPARPVPTAAANSRMQLYPAVAASYAGGVWRFV
jgi:hypothetical protein